jgi:hypothetical protein
MESPGSAPYPDIRLSKLLGPGYASTVEQFLASLTWDTHLGHDVMTRTPALRHMLLRIAGGLSRRGLMAAMTRRLARAGELEQQSVRYYADRSELVGAAGAFVEALFGAPARRAGRLTWCEKTPHNLLFADFLQALVPNSQFIHVYRDPRGVAQSFARQSWASSDLRVASRTVRDVYQRWFAVRERIDRSRLIEISLERFVAEPLATYRALLGRTGLRLVDKLEVVVDPDKVGYWKASLTGTELRILDQELGGLAERMGYEV